MLRIQDDLGRMIGMDEVSDQVNSLIRSAIYNERRKAEGMPQSKDTMHMMFVGPPGVGKTAVANLIGPLYKALGTIPGTDGRHRNDIVEASRSDLVGTHMGDTAVKTKKLFDSARGGVLFIDEAYDLIHGDSDSYGHEAVTTLLKLMEQHRDDTVVILAGYPAEMSKLLDSNPGLRSRFPTTINFPRYSNSDLLKIAGTFFNEGDYKVEQGAKQSLKAAISEFADGNAREVRNMADKIREAHRNRTYDDEGADLTLITTEDARRGLERYRQTRPPERAPGEGLAPKRRSRT